MSLCWSTMRAISWNVFSSADWLQPSPQSKSSRNLKFERYYVELTWQIFLKIKSVARGAATPVYSGMFWRYRAASQQRFDPLQINSVLSWIDVRDRLVKF